MFPTVPSRWKKSGALADDTVKTLQQNVAIGYAVTYIFGSLGTIIVCVNILPRFMGSSIHDDAMAAEAGLHARHEALQPGEEHALEEIVGRAYTLPAGYTGTVSGLEKSVPDCPITVEKIRRAGKQVDVSPDAALEGGDSILLVGHAESIIGVAKTLGTEITGDDDLQLTLVRHEVTLTSDAMHNQTALTLKEALRREATHGVYVMGVKRDGQPLDVTLDTILQKGDVLDLFGSPRDVTRAAGQFGNAVLRSSKTDMIYMCVGLVVGLLVGHVTVRVAGLPMTLGSGGGALLSGLLFGWFRTRRPDIGYMPSGAIQILKDLGLAGFVVVVGLASGLQAVQTIRRSGLSIFIAGVLVTVLPLLVTMVVGRYLIGYRNTAVFAGALSGSRSANPAFGEVLNKAGNAIPTLPFAITYALANVFLILIGPLTVALT